jgi:23S rRNA pseudouridine1911/1915/1917 synthase
VLPLGVRCGENACVSDEPSILHLTPDWLVVDKPAGWHSVRGTTERSGVLETWLATTRPELAALPESGLVHRLDRDTTGCVVVARSARARADLIARFRAGRDVRKVYLARLHPGLSDDGTALLFFTSRHKRSARVSVSPRGEPRHAGRFSWRVLARNLRRGDLVTLELIGAGKRHELRAGCAFLGHPLVGDVSYGGADAPSVQLHAWRVTLDGVQVEAPLPAWAAGDE